MNLWYQSLVHKVETQPYGDILRRTFTHCVDPGTEVDLHGIHNSLGLGVHYRFLEYQDMKDVINNAIRAEKEGYDAFLIGNSSDARSTVARYGAPAGQPTVACAFPPWTFRRATSAPSASSNSTTPLARPRPR